MIILVSDIHMTDGTAGAINIPASAFTGTFTDMGRLACEAGANDVTLVYLGDIFDLIRTALWQNYPMADRPWGDQSLKPVVDSSGQVLLPKSEAAAFEILNKVIEKSPDAFDIMGKDLTEFGFPPNTKRVYVPGNHDRLCNMYPRLRERVCDVLRLQHNPAQPFPHFFADTEHRSFARHGHEWDVYNFEAQSIFNGTEWFVPLDSDYSETPIGDVIAAEIASLLPKLVLDRLPGLDPKVKNVLQRRLMDMFDVRPMAGMIPYLAYQVRDFNDPTITNAVNSGAREVVERFNSMDFVNRWIHKHSAFLDPMSDGEKIKLLIRTLELITVTAIQPLLQAADKLAGFFPGDNFRGKAGEEFQRLDSARSPYKDAMLYVLYGHTHDPDTEAISVLGKGESQAGRVYLNTGMWRPSHSVGLTDGYVSWKNLTYSVIYHPNENASRQGKAGFPAFETWTGHLKVD